MRINLNSFGFYVYINKHGLTAKKVVGDYILIDTKKDNMKILGLTFGKKAVEAEKAKELIQMPDVDKFNYASPEVSPEVLTEKLIERSIDRGLKGKDALIGAMLQVDYALDFIFAYDDITKRYETLRGLYLKVVSILEDKIAKT